MTSHTWGTLGSATFDSVSISPVPWPWTDADIGAPALAGSATYSAGVFSVNGAGADIYATADQFNFVSQALTGNGTFTARVASQANSNAWAKAGLMLRATSDPGAPNYAVFATPANGVAVQWRTAQGGTTGQVKIVGTVPVYLRIVRSASTFTAYTSPDNVSWTAVPGSSQAISMPAAILAGLAVTSHNATALGAATFDSVALSTVTPNNFSIAAGPASLSIAQGASGGTSITTTLISGSAQTVALAVSGLPAGVTATLTPTSVSAGGSATLGLAVAASVPTGTYPLTVTGTAPSATHATTVSLTVTAPPPPLPVPWTDADIGAPALAGSATYSAGVFSVNGAGADIYATADQFNFVSQALTGNGTLTARVASQANSNAWAKAGLMLRATSDPGAPNYAVFATPANGVAVQWRTAQGGTTGQVKIAGTVPVYLRIVRSASTFTAYTSPDNVSWTAVPGSSLTISMPAAILAGLAVTSHNATALGAATFDSVALSTVTPNDFSIAAGPASLSIAQGASGGTSITTALISGSAETVALAVSGLPAGVTATLTPTSVSAGGSATLGLAVAASVPTGTYPLTVTGTAPSATHATTVSLTVTAPPPPLPVPWTDADIGAPALAGSATYSAGVFTVNGAGADIYATADQFNFVSQALTGNGTLSARVASQANSNAWAKAGLMLRATSDPGAPNYAVFATPANGVAVQWRTAQGGTTGQVKIAGTVPVYLRIVRSASTFTAYTSPDGVSWTAVPGSSLTIAMPAAVLAGLAVTCHTATALGAATFDNVGLSTVTPNDFSIAAGPSSLSIAQGASGGTSITTALISGSAETVALAVSGLPAGVTATLTPTSVSAGGSATLGLAVAASVPTGTYPLTVTGTAPSATHATTVSLTVTAPPPPLPVPWTDADIGAPALAGSATYSAGVFTVNGAGADIYATADQFNFVSQALTGNGTLSARVASQTNTNPSAKAGLMFRASSASGSPYYAILMTTTKGVVVQWRTAQGGSTSQTSKVAGVPPLYLRIARLVNTFTAYTSTDGVNWTLVPGSSQTIALPTAVLAGMAVTSHNTGALCAATFDTVGLVPGP